MAAYAFISVFAMAASRARVIAVAASPEMAH
jgi:hypothetical protein